jgi:hypothetical protein
VIQLPRTERGAVIHELTANAYGVSVFSIPKGAVLLGMVPPAPGNFIGPTLVFSSNVPDPEVRPDWDTRRFVVLTAGGAVPDGGTYLGSYQMGSSLYHLFEYGV